MQRLFAVAVGRLLRISRGVDSNEMGSELCIGFASSKIFIFLPKKFGSQIIEGSNTVEVHYDHVDTFTVSYTCIYLFVLISAIVKYLNISIGKKSA